MLVVCIKNKIVMVEIVYFGASSSLVKIKISRLHRVTVVVKNKKSTVF